MSETTPNRRHILGFGAAIAGLSLMPSAFAAEAMKLVGTDGSFDRVKKAGVLTFGTSNDQPFAFLDPKTGGIAGIDAEMLLAMLDVLGIAKPAVTQVDFDGLIPGLLASRMDMVADAMYITEKRKKVVDFSDPWYVYGEALLVPKGNPKKLHALTDLKADINAASQLGTVYLDWLNALSPKPVVTSYPDVAGAMRDLKIGRLDAVLLDAPVAGYAMSTNPDYAASFEMAEGYTPKEIGNIGSAFRKEDAALREAVNFALKAIKASGKDLEILKKWGLGEINRAS